MPDLVSVSLSGHRSQSDIILGQARAQELRHGEMNGNRQVASFQSHD
jgi:hypothetical protein